MTKGRQSDTAAKVDTGRSRKCKAGQEWQHEAVKRLKGKIEKGEESLPT